MCLSYWCFSLSLPLSLKAMDKCPQVRIMSSGEGERAGTHSVTLGPFVQMGFAQCYSQGTDWNSSSATHMLYGLGQVT